MQIIGGDADEDHTQNIGGGTQSNYWGGYIPPSLTGFGTPGLGARAPSIEMPPMKKIYQKSLVSSFSVSFSMFVYNSTRVQ